MEARTINLSPRKNGQGYSTSYTISIGAKEARDCGFLEEATIIEKVVDPENKQIIIRIKED